MPPAAPRRFSERVFDRARWIADRGPAGRKLEEPVRSDGRARRWPGRRGARLPDAAQRRRLPDCGASVRWWLGRRSGGRLLRLPFYRAPVRAPSLGTRSSPAPLKSLHQVTRARSIGARRHPVQPEPGAPARSRRFDRVKLRDPHDARPPGVPRRRFVIARLQPLCRAKLARRIGVRRHPVQLEPGAPARSRRFDRVKLRDPHDARPPGVPRRRFVIARLQPLRRVKRARRIAARQIGARLERSIPGHRRSTGQATREPDFAGRRDHARLAQEKLALLR